MKTYVASMWDDALVTDLRLMELLSKWEITTCFAIAPNTHKKTRCLNDYRSSVYGMKVADNELREFSPFEVCNHSANHLDFAQHDSATAVREIAEGKDRLEQLFGREIVGFCYPYGVGTPEADAFVAATHLYGRTTLRRPDALTDGVKLHVSAKWDENVLSLVGNHRYLLFWGHTYELKNANDWERVEAVYRDLKQAGAEFVTVADLTRRIKENA